MLNVSGEAGQVVCDASGDFMHLEHVHLSLHPRALSHIVAYLVLHALRPRRDAIVPLLTTRAAETWTTDSSPFAAQSNPLNRSNRKTFRIVRVKCRTKSTLCPTF